MEYNRLVGSPLAGLVRRPMFQAERRRLQLRAYVGTFRPHTLSTGIWTAQMIP